MTEVYICDDEPIWIRQMEQAVSDYMVASDWALEIVCKSTCPGDLLDCLRQRETLGGIYLLDIGLKSEINGIELGARIRKLDPEAVLIVVTAHDEMVMDTFRFKLQAADYILKDSGSLCLQIGDILRTMELRYSSLAKRLSAPRIRLFADSSYHYIIKEDIYFVESQKNQHKLLVHMKSEILTIAMPLKDLEKQLGNEFVLCRRGCLINPLHVARVDLNIREIIFDNQERCNCSHRAWRLVMEKIPII